MAKNSYTAWVDGLPLILKIILALPVLDGIFYGIYRIAKGNVIWGIVWIFLGIAVIGAIIDIVSILMYGKAKILVDLK